MEIISFVIGLAVGLTVAGLFLKKRLSDAANIARNEGQVELALLNERLTTATEGVKRLRSDLVVSEEQGEGLRQQLETSHNECAQLTERASRVPALEQELRAVKSNNEDQNQQISALREKLGGAESTVASQLQEIARLTDESRELTVRRDQLLAELQGLNTQLPRFPQLLMPSAGKTMKSWPCSMKHGNNFRISSRRWPMKYWRKRPSVSPSRTRPISASCWSRSRSS